MSERFEQFISKTMYFETGGDKSGAYHIDKDDPGGETKWGISKAAHPETDIKNLTYKEATEIYRSLYYSVFYEVIQSEKIAFKVFDMGVLNGPRTATKLLQRAINKLGIATLRVDGLFGPMTLTAVNMSLAQGTDEQLYTKYVQLLCDRFKRIALNPFRRKFLKGWLKRANYLYKKPVEDKPKTKKKVKNAK